MTRSPVTTAAPSLPHGLQWSIPGSHLRVVSGDKAERVLRDPHIITGVQRSHEGAEAAVCSDAELPSVVQFFDMWYTVGSDYAAFNRELRKAFTPRAVAAFVPRLEELADRQLATLPPSGDLAALYFAPYMTHSSFLIMGVPEAAWPNLSKVSKLVIHLFKQRLLGYLDHTERELAAFRVAMQFLKSTTDTLLRDADLTPTPFLTSAWRLQARSESSWPIAALIGQLLMAGIEPMVTAASTTARTVLSDAAQREAVLDGRLDIGDLAEETMWLQPPFGNVFRWVREPCECLGARLEAGTLIAVDIGAVNGPSPAHREPRGCPVDLKSATMTFGRGGHYCLGANSARLQVAAALRRLVFRQPDLVLEADAARIDTSNNLKLVQALPYGGGRPSPGAAE